MPKVEDCHGPASTAALAVVRRFEQSPPPPLFRLADPLSAPSLPFFDRDDMVIYRRSDSGVIEIKMPGVRFDAMEQLAVEDTIVKIAALEDQRTFEAQSITAAIRERGRVQTLVKLPQGAVEVLGPGGAIIGSEEADGLEVAIVTRHREQSMSSTWRTPDTVIDELFTAFGIPGRDIAASDVRLQFGYFELSKYDQQSTMRPVFLATLDLKADETGIPYRFVTAAAATSAAGVSHGDGLGSWGL